jgi:hypothetical protein
MDMPWKALAAVDKNREYIALLSYLPLKSYGKLFAFFRFTFQIQGQLAASPGALGYALRAQIFSRRFWTLSVWENRQALMEFVAKVPHGEVMKALSPHMGATKFKQWKVAGAGVPPRWDEAIRLMAQES